MNSEGAGALLAGWIAGAAVALADTAILLVMLARDPVWRERVGRTRMRLPILGIVVVNGMMFGWTLVGLVLGAVYIGADQPAFSITVVAVIGLGLVAFAAIRGRPGWPAWATAGVAMAGFAGLLPALEGLGG